MIFSLLASTICLVSTPSDIIAQLKPGVSPSAVAVRNKVTLVASTPGAPFALYRVTTGTSDAAQARLIADTANVVWAEDNVGAQNPENALASKVKKGSSLGVIGDHKAVVAKNANALAQVGWNATLAASSGRIVKMAILDTGLSRKQSALWKKVDASFDAFGGNADDAPKHVDSNTDGIYDEGLGHGTMVAGLADAVAPQVHFVIAKIADSDGNATAWTVIQGLAFAVVNGAEVANLSMGSPTQVAAYNDVSEWCASKGLLVVCATGNAAVEGAWFPARHQKSLCVAGLNADDTLASFSNWDGTTDSAAPAVGLTSQWWDGTLGLWSGTSFAAPFVSAAVADCLRHTGTMKTTDLIKFVTDSGINVDKLNNKKFKSKMGTVLDITALNIKMKAKA